LLASAVGYGLWTTDVLPKKVEIKEKIVRIEVPVPEGVSGPAKDVVEHFKEAGKLDKDSPKLKALTDKLEEAGKGNAQARLLQGLLAEETGDLKKAGEIYSSGLQDFKDQAAMFQAALDRLDALAVAKPDGAAWLVPGAGPDLERLVLLVTALEVAAAA